MDYIVEAIVLGIDAIAFGVSCSLYRSKKSAIKSIEVRILSCFSSLLCLLRQCMTLTLCFQNVQVVEVDRRLIEQVSSQPNKKLDYVVVRGKVKALSSPIRSQNAWNTYGVVQKFTTKEHLVTRHNFGFW